MSLEHYTERRNMARERIVNGQRGKHVSRQDVLAEHMNKAQGKYLNKELNVVASQHDVVIKVMRHETNGFVRVKRQGIGGLFLHGMYKKLAKDHFKAVDRIMDKRGAKPKHASIPEFNIDSEPMPPSPDADDGEFYNPIAVIPTTMGSRPTTAEQKTTRLLINVLKSPDITPSDKKTKKSNPNRDRRLKSQDKDILEEAAIDAINDVNSPTKSELKPVHSRRRKYGIYRQVRPPNFMQELEAAARASEVHSQRSHPSPKSSTSSLLEAAPWRKSSGGASAPSARWSGAGLFPSSMRVSPVQEVPVTPLSDLPDRQEEPEIQNPSSPSETKAAVDLLPLPQVPFPVVVTKPVLKRVKPRQRIPRKTNGSRGYMRLLFREDELDTYQKLKNRLHLERNRMQHRLSAKRCSGNLRDWLERNPPHKSHDIENIEDLMKALKPEDRSLSVSSVES